MTTDPACFTIVPLAERHRADWDQLYSGYLDFYQVNNTPAVRATIWGWIFGPQPTMEGLVAETPDGRAIALAHIRAYPRPLDASTAGFLDDLFVAPDQRGGRLGEAMIAAIAAIGRERGWSSIRWLTRENNYRARTLYDRVAAKTAALTYELKL